MALNFGDMLDSVTEHRGNSLAISSDLGDLSWAEFDARSNALARGLQDLGLKPGDKVCFMLFNGAAYLELLAACFKGRFVHANVNYRYLSKELEYVLDDADADALVYDEQLCDRVEGLSDACQLRLRLISTAADGNALDASSLEDLIRANDTSSLDIERSPEDQLFIYTGGTTGKPKGVMWAHADIGGALLSPLFGKEDRSGTVEDIVAKLDEPKAYLRPLVASPLMHGTAFTAVLTTFANGGHVILTDNSGSFDAHKHWQLVEDHKADALGIVGDTFAKPLLAALEEKSYDTGSLKIIGSSGVMWSMATKQEMLKHVPGATLVDSLGSSEAMALGSSAMTADGEVKTAKFQINEKCRVFKEDGTEVKPGSGETGLLARGGLLPLGYYGDPDKSAETFREFGGQRYCVPGDICSVELDGSITLHGRGSACINSGGEKIFPEEVEEALKLHHNIADALVFGIPDPQWGSAVTAVVRLSEKDEFDEQAVRMFLRAHLSPYKIPKKVLPTEEVIRMPNGKPDYVTAKKLVTS